VAAARGERFGVRVWGAAGFGLGVGVGVGVGVRTVEARRASGVQAASSLEGSVCGWLVGPTRAVILASAVPGGIG
jgi:hypothetical protein